MSHKVETFPNDTLSYVVHDKTGEEILIELKQIDPQSTFLSEQFNEYSEILAEAYMPVEKQFAMQFPESIGKDMFLNTLEPLFKNGLSNVNWNFAEEKIRAILRLFFAEGFAKSMVVNKEVCAAYDHLIVTAKNKETKAPLGIIYFFISKEQPQSNVRVPVFGIAPKNQNRGLGKLLMSSILNQFPETKKILLSTRITNEKALNAYRTWGFAETQNMMEYWVNMECEIEKSPALKKATEPCFV
ncbi:GNAT family N-acetyltransferase [Parachlamydia acanthamoebae]|jgi:ribosomal protein S18 acetylase RimI-like enzyme|uniref:GNAT family N-acetyltransferase n=1 Tax=Parachlamydia acanthamoebae TaxID=83552 RepID=UPI0001C17ABF|nr:GNAT family N-acetyltransferase [Parachlamydia acanthamoebae]EFB41685.1 hypothetical protein pah_c026o137 [Parachlamydia acanthamoebae str. Hall's coccus]